MDVYKNDPISVTKVMIGQRMGVIYLVANKLFSVNPRTGTLPC